MDDEEEDDDEAFGSYGEASYIRRTVRCMRCFTASISPDSKSSAESTIREPTVRRIAAARKSLAGPTVVEEEAVLNVAAIIYVAALPICSIYC